jgi:hypothetical protein
MITGYNVAIESPIQSRDYISLIYLDTLFCGMAVYLANNRWFSNPEATIRDVLVQLLTASILQL